MEDAVTKYHYLTETKNKVYLYIGQFAHGEEDDFIFSMFMHKLRMLSNKSKNLHIVINSTGGDLGELVCILNAIKGFKKVITEIDNLAYSSGGLLFLAGDEHILNPHSTLMLHTYHSQLQGTQKDLIAEANSEKDKYLALFSELMLDTGFLSKREFTKLLDNTEYWFNPEEIKDRLNI